MTPDRWRAVDAILQAALACEPARRDAFVADACAHDDALRREVQSLLGAHDSADGAFLEQPLAAVFGAPLEPPPIVERLARALAGRYELERELARGGMATVYLARDLRHERRVAIKVLREELAAAVGPERFLEEIRVTASLHHPHILPLFDSGSAEGVTWYVMPFVEGETLRARLAREGRFPVDTALRLAREMADALDYAHRRGVVHRDIKPENVLLQGDHALVADFGIALALEHAGGDRLTRTGITLGTPRYMAPEQASGEGTIDARTDVYALGAVLHEMLAGDSTLGGPQNQRAVLRRGVLEPPVAIATRRADVSAALDAAVQRALATRQDDRFPSAASFAAALTNPSSGGERASSATDVERGRATRGDADVPITGQSGRKVSALGAMYVAAAMLVVGLAGGWALSRTSLIDRWTGGARNAGEASMERVRAAAGTVREPPIGAFAASNDEDALTLSIVDRNGRPLRTIEANRPWTPRFSPDGKFLAYGAFGAGRSTSDLWITRTADGSTRRLTDDDADNNDPQWNANGSMVAYSASAPGGKDVVARSLTGDNIHVLETRDGTQWPSDWLRDRSALLVTEESSGGGHDILVQPADGSPPRPYAATGADETSARVSPDGRWVAYTSDESGRAEVYLDTYPAPSHRVMITSGGGIAPVWRADGRELYYWTNGKLVAVEVGPSSDGPLLRIGARTKLFDAPYHGGVSTMYDVSPDGQRFAIVAGAK